MKPSPYIRQDDVQMRLHNTYCMYDGKPVYVTVNVGFNIGEVTTYSPEKPMTAENAKLVNIMDDKFSFVFPELGYFNYKNMAVFVARRPDRNQKQGLDPGTCVVSSHSIGESTLPPSIHNLFSSENFVENLLGKYPSLREALDLLLKDSVSVAISKNVAVGYIGRNLVGLYYNYKLIGTYNRKREVFTITEDRLPKIILSRLLNLGINYE